MTDSTKKPISGRNAGIVAVLCIAAIVLFEMPRPASSGFTDEDIGNIKRSIKEEFEKRPNIKVTQVFLMRKDSRDLAGFAKLKIDGLDLDITKSCDATYSPDGQSMWSCN